MASQCPGSPQSNRSAPKCLQENKRSAKHMHLKVNVAIASLLLHAHGATVPLARLCHALDAHTVQDCCFGGVSAARCYPPFALKRAPDCLGNLL